MIGKRKKFYWCSCAFILWLNGRGALEDIEGLAEAARNVEKGDADLFTSAITRTEVLRGKMTDVQREKFSKLFQRRNVVQIDVTTRVLDMAGKIREWNGKISTPDAIHLATAILYEADEFHTTDGGGKRKRPGDLIPLSGNVAGHKLVIRKPLATQRDLLSGVGPLPDAKDKTSESKP
jgi:predicted nucleic acid-binding protein